MDLKPNETRGGRKGRKRFEETGVEKRGTRREREGRGREGREGAYLATSRSLSRSHLFPTNIITGLSESFTLFIFQNKKEIRGEERRGEGYVFTHVLSFIKGGTRSDAVDDHEAVSCLLLYKFLSHHEEG